MKPIVSFWHYPVQELFRLLDSRPQGLDIAKARLRLKERTRNEESKPAWKRNLFLFFSQYKSPLILLLLVAAILSLVLGEYSDSSVILVLLVMAGVFSFAQEQKAGQAVEKLRALIRIKTVVIREGKTSEIDGGQVVPGDIIQLCAGDIVPADGIILKATDLHVNQSILTGESYPSEKYPGNLQPNVPLIHATNAVFTGTTVISGNATVLVVNVGKDAEVGKISESLTKDQQESAFEKGIRQFGFMLMWLTLGITGLILVLNILFNKPPVDSLLFALALAVGITPELLPVIITVTLSAGATRMAEKKVIVKKLNAIVNLGEMTVLCSDKTGTLTEGAIDISAIVDFNGEHNEKLMRYAYYNAHFETGYPNPMDEAIRRIKDISVQNISKTDEVPYDFIRKRLSIVIEEGGRHIMITKGAVVNVLERCTLAEIHDSAIVPVGDVKQKCDDLFLSLSSKGLRVIAVAYKDVTDDPVITKDDEDGLIFLGFVCFADPLKTGIIDSTNRLQKKGISLYLITGDNPAVAKHVASQIGLPVDSLLTGTDIQALTMDALQQRVKSTRVFAEVEPSQKENIVRALQKNGSVVGFLGDGINDANALKAADVGISVNSAVDVAKEAAALVLMERDLNVIADGIDEGRKTFVNTLKYIWVTSSANFGNMVSMAVFSLAIPFLPLLPIQILLNNFLSDIPALAIGSDDVDAAFLEKPVRWDVRHIRRFMIVFGLQSSVFDFLTFFVLLYVFDATPQVFRTGWFIESLLTEVMIILVVRTRFSMLTVKPSRPLVLAMLLVFCLTLVLPYLPVAHLFELQMLPFNVLLTIVAIAVLYLIASESIKKKLFHFQETS